MSFKSLRPLGLLRGSDTAVSTGCSLPMLRYDLGHLAKLFMGSFGYVFTVMALAFE